MASLHAKLEFESKDWKTAINEVGLLVPTELTSDRYLTVLGSPARTTEELLYKAAYVRFSIPEREVVDGSGALLLAICNSKQHLIVRQAAWAALRGIHLEPDWRGFKATNHRINDSCPEPVLTDDSHQFAKVAAHALRNPESDDLRWLIQYLTVDEFDLPSGFVDLADDFAQILATNAWSAQLIAHDLTRHRYLKKSRPHCDALIAALLDHEPKLAALFKR